MNERRNAVAAIPLAIALFGGSALSTGGAPDNRRFRVAPNASPDLAAQSLLTDEQQAWFEEHNPFGMPTTSVPGNRTLIVRRGYTLAHNNVDLIADWVSFHLTRAYVDGTEARPGTSAFKPDPALPARRRAELADYEGWSGVYDRGHQAASADSKGRGRRVILESFLLSNMTPQASRLNQHKWRLFEDRIQALARGRGELWVITGPAFQDDDGDGLIEYFVIGDDEVAVPTHYYKIVVARTEGTGLEAMALLVPNEALEDEFEDHLVSIDSIEAITGLDFLADLPDGEEGQIEAEVATEIWAVPREG
jgi:endonuclease G